jgi:hypothetical protein
MQPDDAAAIPIVIEASNGKTADEAPAKKQKVDETAIAATGQTRKSQKMKKNAKISKDENNDQEAAQEMVDQTAQTTEGEEAQAAAAAGQVVPHRPSGLYGEVTNKGWDDVTPALSAGVMDIITNKLGFNRMTPVQAGTIPLFLSYKDVCVEVHIHQPFRVSCVSCVVADNSAMALARRARARARRWPSWCPCSRCSCAGRTR